MDGCREESTTKNSLGLSPEESKRKLLANLRVNKVITEMNKLLRVYRTQVQYSHSYKILRYIIKRVKGCITKIRVRVRGGGNSVGALGVIKSRDSEGIEFFLFFVSKL